MGGRKKGRHSKICGGLGVVVRWIQMLVHALSQRKEWRTVEEKNRIRRNLEGFHPETVSKNKPSTEAFFKQIMNFPMPRPRHIEKDVKVFKWQSLDVALRKIIGKYVCPLLMDWSTRK